MYSTNFLKLCYGPGKVVEPFLRRISLERNLKSVYWVSPWLTHLDFLTSTTQKLLQKIQLNQVRLNLITREPETGSQHEEIVNDIKSIPTSSIFYMPTLHAKFYIASTSERRYALLGSANMYAWTNQSYDLGVVIESRGEGEVLIDKLEQLVIELRVTDYSTKA